MRHLKKTIALITAFAIIIVVVIITFQCINKRSDVKRIELKQVRNELKEYQFSSHENLIFDCKIQNANIGSVYKYKLHDHSSDTAGDIEKQNAYNLWQALLNNKTIQPEYSQDSSNCWFVRAEKPYSYGAYYCGGSFGASLWTWKYDENTDINETTVYKSFRGCDDFNGQQYRVGGEDYKLTDAVKFCEEFIEKNLKQYFNKDEELKLINVYVIENKIFDKYTYVFRYSHLIDGVAVDDCDSMDLENEYTRGSYLQIVLAGKNKIYSIENPCYQSSFDDKEQIDELVPLSEAEKILSNQLASQKRYTVTECELKYVCRTTSKAEERYYEPMWCFTLEQYPGQSLSFKRNLTAYVNAITGKVFLYDMSLGQLSELSSN